MRSCLNENPTSHHSSPNSTFRLLFLFSLGFIIFLKGVYINMDQIKIGKFIAEIRKERNLTQLDLANKIGVTDRAVSKWENGRGMPELSLIKPLCNALSISINELFCGERIEKEAFEEKADKNIVETLDYTEKRIKKTRRIFYSFLAFLLIIIILSVSFFAIDVHRMRNDKPVIFSTWGIDYAPPVDLKEEQIQLAIKDFLVTLGDNEEKRIEGVKTFVAFKTYLIEETEINLQYNVYAWVLEEQCYMNKNDIMNYGSYSIPFRFKIKKQETGEKFVIAGYNHPRDGSCYSDDMKKIFPKSVKKDMEKIYKDGTFERLQLEIEEQIKLYFHKKY